jgi:serine/threonine protein kinase
MAQYKQKIVIHPSYRHLTPFLENITQVFPAEGTVIYKERNEIKVFDTGTEEVIVKSFKIPNLINRFIYSFFRLSKARRSYEHANILMEKQINTPQPVAYIENYRNGLLFDSYYIAIYKAYSGILREFRYHPLAGQEDLASAFARFTAHIHEQNILPLDYSPGNILYEKQGDIYHFCLIDINRMRFQAIDPKTGCRNFRRLWGNEELIVFLSKEYARVRHFDEKVCEELAIKYFRIFWRKYAKKHKGFVPYVGEIKD